MDNRSDMEQMLYMNRVAKVTTQLRVAPNHPQRVPPYIMHIIPSPHASHACLYRIPCNPLTKLTLNHHSIRRHNRCHNRRHNRRPHRIADEQPKPLGVIAGCVLRLQRLQRAKLLKHATWDESEDKQAKKRARAEFKVPTPIKEITTDLVFFPTIQSLRTSFFSALLQLHVVT